MSYRTRKQLALDAQESSTTTYQYKPSHGCAPCEPRAFTRSKWRIRVIKRQHAISYLCLASAGKAYEETLRKKTPMTAIVRELRVPSTMRISFGSCQGAKGVWGLLSCSATSWLGAPLLAKIYTLCEDFKTTNYMPIYGLPRRRELPHWRAAVLFRSISRLYFHGTRRRGREQCRIAFCVSRMRQ